MDQAKERPKELTLEDRAIAYAKLVEKHGAAKAKELLEAAKGRLDVAEIERRAAKIVAGIERRTAAKPRVVPMPGRSWRRIGGPYRRPEARKLEVVEPEPEPKAEPEPEAKPAKEEEWNGLLDRDTPLDNARKLVGMRYWHREAMMPRLRFWQGEFWEWKGKHWKPIDENTMRARLYEFLDGAERQVKGYRVRFEPTYTDVNKTIDALRAETNLEPDREMPGWLLGEPPTENLRESISLENGLLNVRARRLLPHTPRFWSPNVLEFGYDPKAKAPRFEKFLEEIFPGDTEAQRALVEMIGLCLTDETKYQKAFMFVGPRRGGRGTIGRLLRGLIGEENYVGPRLRGMVRQFGMQSWIGKKVALFPDVRTDGLGIDRLSTVSETLLTVTGEDGIEIERKYIGSWIGKLSARVIMFSNELIKFQDDSGALPSRFITWQMRQSFKGREDPNLTGKLLAERPGILNLALAGLDRLRDRGEFIQPGSGAEMAEELEGLASHVSLFVAECCEVGPEHEVRVEALYQGWRQWCGDKGIRYFLAEEQFSQKLKACVHSVTRGRPRSGGPSRPTVFVGIGLKGRWWMK